MSKSESPYEYYDGKLGVKSKFLTTGKKSHPESLKLIAPRTLRHRLTSETCTEQRLREGSWAGEALVLFSSLSREWKDRITTKFGKPEKVIKKSWFAEHFINDRGAFNFYVAYRYGENNQEKLDLKFVEEYVYNASVLNTVLRVHKNRKAYAKALGRTQIDIWESLSNDVNAFREVPHTLPNSRDGLRRKASQYRKEGYKALISGKLKNKNAKKVAKAEQKALLDELLAKHTNLDNELICTLYNIVAEKMDWATITAQTVANRKEKSNLVTYAGRSGTRALKNNVLMQVKRSRPSIPMLYWTLDGWDVELLYQETTTDKKGNTVTTYHNRLTMVVVLDAFNNYPVGYAIGTHETPDLIKAALQNAMQHVRTLFGHFYMPNQLQSDNYALKMMRPIYESIANHHTPAQVGNAKAKVIEPYFGQLNKSYCRLFDNWSGHNVDSGSNSQPNTEYLQKIKKYFPDRAGCESQIRSIIDQERAKKQAKYKASWESANPGNQIMTTEAYLLTLGSTTGYTNRLTGEGLVMTISGQKHVFDSFDLNFRHAGHRDWNVMYDENDLSVVLAVSADGSERFILEEKYIQPMALAERTEDDAQQLKRVRDFNKTAVETIIEERANNARILEPLLSQPELNDTLAKHLLTDSLGQHKNHKSAERIVAKNQALRIEEKIAKKEELKKSKTFLQQQQEYYESKIDVNEYLT